ncbi:MazG nucleotide pyrophosphohydrolase domain-containing protein [uncultured Ruminococcus sp.]|uniref:MazG nucleotide pyrophosphohydrolase domain-containing protein n=1 Tax=uncultured Ruminococcus sp. TaxID=165186 RepID=UPI0025F15702|nr:MazG nucleotide pyrophosphohydrolase domain-containing protein [uncultured Ruminococcus sp.]
MTGMQEAAIEQITSHYTYDQQRDVAVEECSEFIQAVCKCKRGKKGAFENLKEEVADVLIMAEQMRQYIGTETVDKIINAKLQRQLNRIMAEGMTKT